LGAGSDFGAFLVHRGLLSGGSWGRVQEVLLEARQGMAGTIAGLGLLSEKDLASALSDHAEIPLATADDFPLSPVDIPGLNPTFLKSCHILPARDLGSEIEAIAADPTDDYARRALAFAAEKTG
jgi:general secretion pathway protein E